jgi:hypothetical protein
VLRSRVEVYKVAKSRSPPEFHAAIRALELIGKDSGLFLQRQDTSTANLAQRSPEECKIA